MVYQVLSLGFLFFANTYLNNLFIPDSLRWKDGVLREDLTGLALAQLIVLIIEGGLLILIMFYVNRWFLLNVPEKVDDARRIAMRTSGIQSAITAIFIAFVIYVSFK
ncbi:hypothetical protein JHJ32_22230 [Parapedobacter sp. ISTM3]|nr:hypothetical protein [Parapedobacter sp. ISTM3]